MPSSKSFFEDCLSEELIWQSDKPLEDSSKDCDKNGHHNFFEIHEFAANLPDQYILDQDLVKQIRAMADLTVHMEISQNREYSTFGSGFIQRARTHRGTACPDDNCPQKISGSDHAWGVVTVTTVFHVVKTELDAKNAKVTIDYGSPDATALSGFRLLETDKETNFDWCAVECFTHDVSLIPILNDRINAHESQQKVTYDQHRRDTQRLTVMVGHPHGGIKKVSFGYSQVKRTLKEVRSTQDWCQYRHTAHSCPGSSGSPVLILGQPLCGYGYWFGHPHNHSGWHKDKNVAVTSIGADNVDDSPAPVENDGA